MNSKKITIEDNLEKLNLLKQLDGKSIQYEMVIWGGMKETIQCKSARFNLNVKSITIRWNDGHMRFKHSVLQDVEDFGVEGICITGISRMFKLYVYPNNSIEQKLEILSNKQSLSIHRDYEIIMARKNGDTYLLIANKHNITKERVRQILKEYNLDGRIKKEI